MDRLPSRAISIADAFADPDAFKTSIATATTPQSYSGGALNGAVGQAQVPITVGTGNRLSVSASFTTTTAAGAYVVGSKVTFTGEDHNGVAITEQIALTQANGNETVSTVKGFRKITQIDVEAQALTTGTFTFGYRDVLIPGQARGIRAGGTGDLKLGFSDGATDTIQTLVAGEKLDLLFSRLYKDAGTVATKVTLFLGG